MERDWLNDWNGFFGALLKGVGITPNGNVDTALTSQFYDALLMSIYPVGAPIPWPLAAPPMGYLMMTGQSFNPTTFPKLAQAYPSGSLPDMRGEFVRGWDNGRGVDAGRVVLSTQAQQIIEHTHNMTLWTGTSSVLVPKTAAVTGAPAITQGDGGQICSDIDASGTNNPSARALGTRGVTSPTSIGETRPRNIAFNYIVRAA